MGTNSGLLFGDSIRSRRILDASCLAPTVFIQVVSLSQSALRQTKSFMRVSFTAIDCLTNGTMVDFILASVADGYERCATLGQASASSFAILMNSTIFGLPVSSVAFAPAAL